MVQQIRNLQFMFGPVRDQGGRNTCLALANSDLHAGVRGPWLALSCKYLFYHSQRRAGRPPGAAGTLPSTLAALRHVGHYGGRHTVLIRNGWGAFWGRGG